jgi:hypothetical protein
LLRILMGEIEPDRGSVQLAPAGLRVGYLPHFCTRCHSGRCVAGGPGRARSR